jgi:hypothetical protein
MAKEVFWAMSKESFRQFRLPKISEFEIVCVYLLLFQRYETHSVHKQKFILESLLYFKKSASKNGLFSIFTKRPSWKKRGGGMKFKTSNAHNFLIDYPIFTNKDSKCSAQ